MKTYGMELILDLHDCDSSTFNRKSIKKYFERLCASIGMERCRLCWWDDYGVPLEEQQTGPHLKGTSAVQFIKTSTIVIHTLDILKNVYVNVFSCKEFDTLSVKKFTENWFQGKVVKSYVIRRR